MTQSGAILNSRLSHPQPQVPRSYHLFCSVQVLAMYRRERVHSGDVRTVVVVVGGRMFPAMSDFHGRLNHEGSFWRYGGTEQTFVKSRITISVSAEQIRRMEQ